MQLTFVHDCLPQNDGQNGCPIAGREIDVTGSLPDRFNEYVVPDVRCMHTNSKLKLVAIDKDRDI